LWPLLLSPYQSADTVRFGVGALKKNQTAMSQITPTQREKLLKVLREAIERRKQQGKGSARRVRDIQLNQKRAGT